MKIRLLLIIALILIYSCDDSSGPGESPDLELADNIVELQAQGSQALLDMLEHGADSTAALDSVARIIGSDPEVETVTISDYGLSIQYKSGLRGGVIIDPLDMEDVDEPPAFDTKKGRDKLQGTTHARLSLRTGSQKVLFMNPSYFERQKLANKISDYLEPCSRKSGMDSPDYYINEECTVEQFTKLSDYGIIHIYSHGFPYPSLQNIEQVYVYSGEIVNDATTKKYWADAKRGDLLMVSYRDGKNYYMLDPAFINRHNDFSDNSPLFYGGFCFSGLGSWRQTIVDEMGGGAYVGFDWAVNTGWNAFWASAMYSFLGDTTATEAYDIEYWYQHIHQNYQSKKHSRYVSISFNGAGDLKLWGRTGFGIAASKTSALVGEEVSFIAEIEGELPKNYELMWDFGDATDLVYKSKRVTVKHEYYEAGSYEVFLTLTDTDTYMQIGQATLDLQINNDYSKHIGNLKYLSFHFDMDLIETTWSNYDGWGASNIDYDNIGFDHPLIWSGRRFQCSYNYRLDDDNGAGYSNYYFSVSGTVSDDYQSVESIDLSWTQKYQENDTPSSEENVYEVSVTNLPMEWLSIEYFKYSEYGPDLLNNVQSFRWRKYNVYYDGSSEEEIYEQVDWQGNNYTPKMIIDFYRDDPR